MTHRIMFSVSLTLIFALSALVPPLNKLRTNGFFRASANTAPPAPAVPASPAEPQAGAGCDPCRPKINPAKVTYLRFNGTFHEVNMGFTYQLPSCIPNLNGVEFKVVRVELQFPNGVRLRRGAVARLYGNEPQPSGEWRVARKD